MSDCCCFCCRGETFRVRFDVSWHNAFNKSFLGCKNDNMSNFPDIGSYRLYSGSYAYDPSDTEEEGLITRNWSYWFGSITLGNSSLNNAFVSKTGLELSHCGLVSRFELYRKYLGYMPVEWGELHHWYEQDSLDITVSDIEPDTLAGYVVAFFQFLGFGCNVLSSSKSSSWGKKYFFNCDIWKL